MARSPSQTIGWAWPRARWAGPRARWAWAPGLLACALASAAPPAAPAEMLTDAELTDLCFVDVDRGWAVGERGVIWRTDDGGRHWRLQHQAVTCRLESVCFLNADHGFAVGGWREPHSPHSRGVVLQTTNGGLHWRTLPAVGLPWLKRARFVNAREGWVLGVSSDLYPTGVLRTTDGGLTWVGAGRGRAPSSLAGDFLDARRGVIGGAGGLTRVQGDTLVGVDAPPIAPRPARRILFVDAQVGWAVGEGGLVLLTRDGGASWRPPPGALPSGAAREFDFAALAAWRSHVWIAGAPGGRVLHSADLGRTWRLLSTGQTLPLNALFFLDDQRGYAAGALGAIWATRDGGASWRKQKDGGARVAVLGLFADDRAVPWEALAQLAAAEDYLTRVEVLCRPDWDAPRRAEDEPGDRLRAALARVGASGGDWSWRFPTRQSGLRPAAPAIVGLWDYIHAGKGRARLEEHLARLIRQWRPEIILTEPVSALGDEPLARVVNQAVLAAVDLAASDTAFPDQLVLAGLEPWRARKVFGCLPAGEEGSLNVHAARYLPKLGTSLGDHAAPARALLGRDAIPAAPQTGFRLLLSHTSPHAAPGEEAADRDFFAGLAVAPGGEARRPEGHGPAGAANSLRRLSEKRRNVRRLLETTDHNPLAGAAWLGQLDDLLAGLNEDDAADLLRQLAARYEQTGRGPLAAEALEQLVARHPRSPAAEAGLAALTHYLASGEFAWRNELAGEARRDGVFPVAQASFAEPATIEPADPTREAAASDRGAASVVTARAAERWGPVAAHAERAEREHPVAFATPALRHALAQAHAATGQKPLAEAAWRALAANRDDVWAANARGELWLANPRGDPPKPLYRAARAESRPRLDGRLDDPAWRQARFAPLQGPLREDAEFTTKFALAHDGEFLYLAAECRQPPPAAGPAPTAPAADTTGDAAAAPRSRQRDADLTRHDRVEWCFDVDRDYVTYFRLTVDARGWVADACGRDATWNPTWYVAHAGDEQRWTVEAAIPGKELAPRAPRPGETWALGAQRVAPGAGFQSWTRPAAVDTRPEGFGWLVLE